ncbi:hypothetical protein NPIL_294431 [Nephila pilipes]|uniref:Uncharacterized protein n=1 Tax=Nephila pilipes TaxID=299642 RepID=A0A8X6UBS6_NEPPI|nr:hypothetical protein NPIL_294431 [Nephila pilipes]
MFATVLIAIILVHGNEGRHLDDNCNDFHFMKCFELFPEEMKEEGVMNAAPTEEILDKNCPEILKMTKCIEDYYYVCPPAENLIFDYYTYDKDFYKELCNINSALRSQYLQHQKCYEDLESIHVRCRNSATDAYLDYERSGNDIEGSSDEITQSCL